MPPIPAEQQSPYDGGVIPPATAHTIANVMALASIGRTTVYAEIKMGRLKARKLGRKTVVLDSDLRAWLESLPAIKSAA